MSSSVITVRLKGDLLLIVNQKAREEKLNRSEFINKAISYYLLKKSGEDSKEDDLSVILSAINESAVLLKEFIASRESEEHVKESFSYKMLLQFVRRISAGIVIASDKNDTEKLKKIYKDPKVWELLK